MRGDLHRPAGHERDRLGPGRSDVGDATSRDRGLSSDHGAGVAGGYTLRRANLDRGGESEGEHPGRIALRRRLDRACAGVVRPSAADASSAPPAPAFGVPRATSFRILDRLHEPSMPDAIYLDHAATTPPDPRALAEYARLAADAFGNPSSTHRFGADALRALTDAREFLRGTLLAARLVFTSGGTEADMLGIVGSVWRRPPGRVLVGAADHPAVTALEAPLRRLNQRLTKVPVTSDGDIDPEALFDLLGSDVRAVAILHGHNELGTLARVDELVGLVRRVAPSAHVHLDIVQAYGKVPIDLDELDVDSAAVSGHKLHGPRGVGFLALSNKAEVTALIAGGGQEEGLRGGTENVAGAAALAHAADTAFSHLASTARHTGDVASAMFAALARANGGDAERLGHPDRHLPHILSLRLPGIVGSTLQERMNARGVAFSVGAACHAHDGSGGTNPVHEAIGLSRRESREVIRLSFSRTTTRAEVERAAAIFAEEIAALRAQAPRRAGAERAATEERSR
ncbi:MAG: aminotransferase class V-fold PLP-dependent enzyme [Planctomycetota bacterium]